MTTESHIERLHPALRTRAAYFIAILRYVGVPAEITSSRRTLAEQRRLVERGRSRTLNSKHLTGHAFDFDVRGWSRDAIPAAFWPVVGELGEALGMRWGGRWKSPYDPGHFEI